KGNVNCPMSVTAAAVYYVFRCLLPAQTPACAGSFRPIKITAPKGCLLNAEFPSAVAAGNVETSTRIVDVILGALAQAIPEKIPAASHGSMNNIAMGYVGDEQQQAWDYYETIGGGMGASSTSDGQDGVQTHMTNTLNTPIESLEMNYPLRVNRYQIRRGSGGEGEYRGGDGLVREFEFLAPTEVTVLSERRRHAPWGLVGAESGEVGLNHSGQTKLPGKFYRHFGKGDSLTIETAGGGGYD
ncbi:MAG: hydantoinase B/oxoprolinase family protein, partial [Gammaproteobacteria bacterium]|nr:hydantoinase B/oxoprolinase family protein [Gammaproteobacteria bacterium]